MHLMSQVEGLNVWQSLPQIDDGIIQFYFFHPAEPQNNLAARHLK